MKGMNTSPELLAKKADLERQLSQMRHRMDRLDIADPEREHLRDEAAEIDANILTIEAKIVWGDGSGPRSRYHS